MNKKRRRIGLWILVAAAVIIAAVVIVNVFGNRSNAPQVTVSEVKRGKIVSTVSGTGELRAANQVDISAEMVSRVKELYVREGQEVKKGELLCLLDETGRRSNYQLAKARYQKAAAEFERTKKLYADSLKAPAEYERIMTEYQVAKAQLEQSADELKKTRIYAPISGRVVRLNVEEGEAVMMGTMNNPGTVMMTLADLSAMEMRIDVDESDVVAVEVGQPAKVNLDAMPDTSFEAEVKSVGYMPSASSAVAEAEGVTDFEVILDLNDPSSLHRPGMSGSAEIETAVRSHVVVCPLQAVGRKDIEGETRETVFVLKDGKAQLAPIRTGASDGRFVEVTEGLKEGETLITGPYQVLRTLSEGDEVKPKEKESAPYRER